MICGMHEIMKVGRRKRTQGGGIERIAFGVTDRMAWRVKTTSWKGNSPAMWVSHVDSWGPASSGEEKAEMQDTQAEAGWPITGTTSLPCLKQGEQRWKSWEMNVRSRCGSAGLCRDFDMNPDEGDTPEVYWAEKWQDLIYLLMGSLWLLFENRWRGNKWWSKEIGLRASINPGVLAPNGAVEVIRSGLMHIIWRLWVRPSEQLDWKC